MKPAHQELARRLAAERERFGTLGARAARAAQDLQATTPPDAELLAGLTAAARAFGDLRQAVLAEAVLLLDPPPPPESLATLTDLGPVLESLVLAEETRVRRARWETARREALDVLDRLAGLTHREDAGFAPLAAAQADARAAREQIAGSKPEDFEAATRRLGERVRMFGDLVALAEGWSALDDERCSSLQDSIAEGFGRPLALAALRGKLGRAGEAPPEPVVTPPVGAPDAPVAPGAPIPIADAPPPIAPPPSAPPTPAPPVPSPPSAEPRPVAAPIAAPPPPPAPPLPADPEQRAKADALERLAAEQAPWWVRARAGWVAMRKAGLSLTAAAGPTLERFPALLSIPIQRAGEIDGGGLAEGYALLLEHVDQLEEGFVGEALTRLNPQFTAASARSYPLGQELYLHLVAEGRLYRTYPDFVREVLAGALPRPGFWAQGGLAETEAETVVFTRPDDTAGAAAKETRAITEDAERYTAHAFEVTVAPLTTRFYTLEGPGPFEHQRTVEVRLTEGGSASDRAWIVAIDPSGAAAAPRKHRVGGTKLEDLGRAFRSLWIAVFNPDPTNDKRYTLTLTLGKKVPPPSRKDREKEAAKASPFKRRA